MAIRTATPGAGYEAPPAASGSSSAPLTLTQTYKVQLPTGQIISVNSQAEVDALRNAYSNQNPIQIGPTRTQDNPVEWLETATDALSAVSGYLQGSAYRRRIDDLDEARAELAAVREELVTAVRSNPDLQPFLRLADVQTKLHDAEISVLASQIVAVDLATGGAATKVIARFFPQGGSNSAGGNGGTALAFGAGAIGLGLLASNNRRSNNRR